MRNAYPSLTGAWDAAAEGLEADPMRPVRYEKCLRYLSNLDRSSRIAEIGCGEGSGLLYLASLGFHNLVGTEVSGERLRRAQAKLGRRAALIQTDTSGQLPFSNGDFDALVSAAVIEHVVDPLAFVRELARVVRPGGYVVISSDCYVWRVLQMLGIYRSLQPVDRALFPSTLFHYFQRNGLDLVHYQGFPLPGQEFRFLRLLAHALLKPLKPIVHWLYRSALRSPKPCPDPFIHAKEFKVHPWHRQLRLVAYLRLIFSDENVFFLIKKS
jgi:SAM-dependent methyltransferase